jgi:hypothetical protein
MIQIGMPQSRDEPARKTHGTTDARVAAHARCRRPQAETAKSRTSLSPVHGTGLGGGTPRGEGKSEALRGASGSCPGR